MLQHRHPASARGRRRGGEGSSLRPKRTKAEAAFEMVADPGPVILTRAELQRRTRERSRLAALKVAEEHGKVRKGGTVGVGQGGGCSAFRVQRGGGGRGSTDVEVGNVEGGAEEDAKRDGIVPFPV